MIHTPLQALFALLMVNLIWGVGFVVIDDAINVMPVNSFNAFRFAIATLVLLPMYFLSRKSTKDEAGNSSLSLFKTGFGLGILLFLGFSLQAEGMLYTSVSNAGFITGMCVPLVPVLGFLFFNRKVGKEVWISAVIATIGLYFLTVGDKLEFNKGDILVAISALCYAAHITMMGKYSRRFSIIPLSIVQLGAVACYSAVAACFESSAGMHAHYEPLNVQLSNWNVIGAILYSGIFASAFAYYVQTASQRLIEPDKVALTFALEPIIAHIAAFFFLAEYIGVKGWFGCCLIIAGMLYSELGTKRVTKMRALDQLASS